MRNDRIVAVVDEAVEAETTRLGSALGSYRGTRHSLGPKGSILAQVVRRTEPGWTIRLTRNPHELEGTKERSTLIGLGVTAEGKPTAALDLAIRRLVDPVDRMIRREAAIISRTDDEIMADGGLSPKWAYSAHRMLLAMMKVDAFDPSPLLTLPYRMSRGPNGVDVALQRNEDHVPTWAEGPAYAADNLEGMLELDVMDVASYGENNFERDRRGVVYRKGRHNRPEMYIGLADMLPETVVNTLAGRRLDDVIRHPAWGGAMPDVRIVNASNGIGCLILTLSRVMDPVAEAPDGMDVSWRTTR